MPKDEPSSGTVRALTNVAAPDFFLIVRTYAERESATLKV